jgi:hypothetical protein
LSRYNTSSTTSEKSGWWRSKHAESSLTQYFRALTRSVEQQAQFVQHISSNEDLVRGGVTYNLDAG